MSDTPDSQSSEFSSQRTPVAAEESQRASANTARETITYTMLPALISGLLIALVLFTLNGTNSRIDTTNSRIDRLDEKIYRLDEKMDTKFEEVDRKIGEVRGTLKTLLAVLEVQNEIPAGLSE